MPERIKILFVCGRNQWRSPTAERIYRRDPRVLVRSAGVSEKARRRVSLVDVAWTDLILVMEREHAARIRAAFARGEHLPSIESLDIHDDYGFMDDELIDLIRTGTEHYIGQRGLTGIRDSGGPEG